MIELHSVYIVLIIKSDFLEELVLTEAYELTCIGKEMVNVNDSSYKLWLCYLLLRTKTSCALQSTDARTVFVGW